MSALNLTVVHSSWQECLQKGLAKVDSTYLENLQQSQDWLPGPKNIFNMFSLPIDKISYILLGESPYPRRDSANGFAFWDAQVKEIWSPTGLSTKANRATSLRNLLKMLLLSEGYLDSEHLTQADIAKADKHDLVQTNSELFSNFLDRGFLLLNASLVLQEQAPPQKDAKAWFPFMKEVMTHLWKKQPHTKLILLGRIAKEIDDLMEVPFTEKLYAEHPYNHSFITNPDVISFFKPLHLLKKSM